MHVSPSSGSIVLFRLAYGVLTSEIEPWVKYSRLLGVVQSGIRLTLVLSRFLLNFTASPAADLRGRLYVGSAPACLFEAGKIPRGQLRSSRHTKTLKERYLPIINHSSRHPRSANLSLR